MSRQHNRTQNILTLAFLPVALAAGVTDIVGLQDKGAATQALQDAGYENIQHTGKGGWYTCPYRQTLFRDNFTTTAANGRTVNLTVCKGLSLFTNRSIQIRR